MQPKMYGHTVCTIYAKHAEHVQTSSTCLFVDCIQPFRCDWTSLVFVVLSLEWTFLGTSRPPGAVLCVTWVQGEVWFRGCSPICWQMGGAPVQEAPAFPQTPLPLNPPPRRSWRRITTGTLSTPDFINTFTDIRETPTVSYIIV